MLGLIPLPAELLAELLAVLLAELLAVAQVRAISYLIPEIL